MLPAHSSPGRTSQSIRRSPWSTRTTRRCVNASTFGTHDVHHDWPVVAVPEIVRNVSTLLVVDGGAQSERLRRDVMHRRIEVRVYEVGQLQPRLVDDMAPLGRRPIRARVVALTEVPAECAPRSRTKQSGRRHLSSRHTALLPRRWPICNGRGTQVNRDDVRHRCTTRLYRAPSVSLS